MAVTLHTRVIRRFTGDTAGNVAMIFALSIIPIISIAGLAIDLQRTSTQKNKVQHVIDSAVLAGSKSMQQGKDSASIAADVNNYVAALLKEQGGGISCGSVQLGFTDESQDMSATINCSQPTTLSQVMGKDKLDFVVSSTSTYGIGKVDVAFVFDVSGSMTWEGRLGDLKDSATIAVETLLPADVEPDGTVRIAISAYNHSLNAGDFFDSVTQRTRINNNEKVQGEGNGPYLADANYSRDDDDNGANKKDHRARRNAIALNGHRIVDASNRRFFYYEERDGCYGSQSWECRDDNDHFDWDVVRMRYDQSDLDNYPTCVRERVGDEAYTDAPPVGDDAIPAGQPEWDFGDPSWSSWWQDYKYDGWKVIENDDGVGAWDAYTDRYTRCTDVTPVPLTDNRNKLINHIEDMEAFNGTAGHVGLAWGWYLISPRWSDIWPSASKPWPDDEEDMAKAVILMTDGDFNNEHGSNPVDAFNHAAQLCQNMKNAPKPIQIYTVGFKVPNNVQKDSQGRTILEICATSSSHAFEANSAAELDEAYSSIAQSISDLRIAY